MHAKLSELFASIVFLDALRIILCAGFKWLFSKVNDIDMTSIAGHGANINNISLMQWIIYQGALSSNSLSQPSTVQVTSSVVSSIFEGLLDVVDDTVRLLPMIEVDIMALTSKSISNWQYMMQ
jgi:hypothetical protein